MITETPTQYAEQGERQKNARLTNRQQQIYDFLEDRIQSSGYAPSVREIGEFFNIRSPNGVVCHLRALEKKGMIRRDKNVSRAISLTDANANLRMPFMGTLHANGPIVPAPATEQSVNLGKSLAGSSKTVLQIVGHEFQSLGVCEGDSIVVDLTATPTEGSMVLVRNQMGLTSLFRKTTSGLSPAIASGRPFEVAEQIGVVTGLVREWI